MLWRWLLAWLLVWIALGAQAQSSAMQLKELRIERSEGALLLSATLQIDLAPTLEDALRKGIPLYFEAEADIARERWYWTDKRVATERRYMRLTYQPLTRRWRFNTSPEPLTNSGLGVHLGQTYDSYGEALAALQRISRWQIAQTSDVEGDAQHMLRFRFRLDTGQLPRALQFGAVGQADWHMAVERRVELTTESVR